MKFSIQKQTNDVKTILLYRRNDLSFDSEPLSEMSFSSIQINELQLEIDHDGNILYVWGYCPLFSCLNIITTPVTFTSHCLQVTTEIEFVPGISIKYNEDTRWPIYMNKEQGWICIGNPTVENVQMVLFAPNSVATFENEKLIAVWLKPIFCD